jgi:hypothetical protein
MMEELSTDRGGSNVNLGGKQTDGTAASFHLVLPEAVIERARALG